MKILLFDDLLPPEPETLATLRSQPHATLYVVSDQELFADPYHARPVHPAWGVAAQLRTLGFSHVFVVKKPITSTSKQTESSINTSLPTKTQPSLGQPTTKERTHE